MDSLEIKIETLRLGILNYFILHSIDSFDLHIYLQIKINIILGGNYFKDKQIHEDALRLNDRKPMTFDE